MSTEERPSSYGYQDFLGGVTMGQYRQGELPGGFSYCFEATGIQTSLNLFRENENVFSIWSQDQEGVMLAIPKRVGVRYDQDGNLAWASLFVNSALYQAVRQGKISLPKEVVDKVRNQLVNGQVWMVTMNFTSYEPIVFFNRQQREATAPYKLEFDRGWRYPIPGAGWGVGVVQNGDLLGFEIAGSDGLGQKFWFNRSLDRETLPTEATVAGLEVEKLKGTFFPGYPLAMAEAGGKGK